MYSRKNSTQGLTGSTQCPSTLRTLGRTSFAWELLHYIWIAVVLGGPFAFASVVVVEAFGGELVGSLWELLLGWITFLFGLMLLKFSTTE